MTSIIHKLIRTGVSSPSLREKDEESRPHIATLHLRSFHVRPRHKAILLLRSAENNSRYPFVWVLTGEMQ